MNSLKSHYRVYLDLTFGTKYDSRNLFIFYSRELLLSKITFSCFYFKEHLRFVYVYTI